MKIGLINNLYKPYQKGGAERVVELLNNQLIDLGHSVFIISTRPKLKKDNEEINTYYLDSNYSELNQLSYLKRLLWQIYNLVNLKKYWQISKIFKKEKPDLVISHNLMGLGLLTPLAVKKSQARQIQVLHDIQLLHPSGLMYWGQERMIDSPLAKIYQHLIKLLFNLNNNLSIVSPSKWLLDLHSSHNLFKNNQKTIIPNPLPEASLITNRTKDSKDFIFIGQLEYHKGLDLFIKAATRFTDYNFLIIGDGSLKDKITESANLKILGRKTSEEVSELLNNSLAVIIPSRCYENSPTVIYEAAIAGTPVIAANLGGIPELTQRFGGLLFEPDNLDSLVMAITEFLEKGIEMKPLLPQENYAKIILNKL